MKKLVHLIHTRGRISKNSDAFKSEKGKKRRLPKQILTSRLRSLLVEGTPPSTAREYVYGSAAIDRNRMHQLAHRLQQAEMDELFQQNLLADMRTPYNKSRYRIYGALRQADALFIKGQIETAEILWEKTFVLARRHGLTLEGAICAQHLCYLYAVRKKKVKRRKMLGQYLLLVAAAEAERKAAMLYEELVLFMHNKVYYSEEKKKKSFSAVRKITALAKKYRTHPLWLAHFRTGIYHCYFTHNYREMLSICKDFRAYLNRHLHVQQNALWAAIAHHEIYACIALRHYRYAFALEEEHEKYLHPDSPNWYTHQENYFQLHCHAGQYEKAQQIYNRVVGSRHARAMSEDQREVWKIFSSYLHLALHHSHQIRQLKARYYFYSLRKSSSDKKGMNFQIQAALVMYLLVQNSDEHMRQLRKTFSNYVSRHISRKKNYRSYLFAKMLLLVFKCKGDAGEATRFGYKFYRRLFEFKDRAVQDREITEIIPYEHLWNILLQQLLVKADCVAA